MKKRKPRSADPAQRELMTALSAHPVGLHVISSWFSDGALGKMSAEDLLGKDAIEAENKYYQENWVKAASEKASDPLPRPYAVNAARFQRDCREVENYCTALERAALSRDQDLIKSSHDNLSQRLETIPPQDALLLTLGAYLEARHAKGPSKMQIKNAREILQSKTDEKIGFGALRQIILRTKKRMPSRIVGTSIERLIAAQMPPNIDVKKMRDVKKIHRKPVRVKTQTKAPIIIQPKRTLLHDFAAMTTMMPELCNALCSQKLFYSEAVDRKLSAHGLAPATGVFNGLPQYLAGSKTNQLTDTALDLAEMAQFPPSLAYKRYNFSPNERSTELDTRFGYRPKTNKPARQNADRSALAGITDSSPRGSDRKPSVPLLY